MCEALTHRLVTKSIFSNAGARQTHVDSRNGPSEAQGPQHPKSMAVTRQLWTIGNGKLEQAIWGICKGKIMNNEDI